MNNTVNFFLHFVLLIGAYFFVGSFRFYVIAVFPNFLLLVVQAFFNVDAILYVPAPDQHVFDLFLWYSYCIHTTHFQPFVKFVVVEILTRPSDACAVFSRNAEDLFFLLLLFPM